MQELSAVKFEEKKSRFFAHLYEVENPGELDDIINIHHKSYKKAAHHCSAVYFSGRSGWNQVESFKNDREVGHPGKALLEILKKHSLDSHVLVVSRLFGGIKLGPAGVTRAFRKAGEYVVMHHLRAD